MMKHALIAVVAMVLGSFTVQAREGFSQKINTAQYKGSDYEHVVHVERGISLEKAFEIAENSPEIDYFFYTKGTMMVLDIPRDVVFDASKDRFSLVTKTPFIYDSGELGEGFCRVFQRGDAVFFKKEGLWLGSAPGLADTYVKMRASDCLANRE